MTRLLIVLFFLLTPTVARATDRAHDAAREAARIRAEARRQALESAQQAAEQMRTEAERARMLSELDRLSVLSASEGEPETIRKVVPARRDALIIIQNGNGSIRVVGWSRPEVAINCTLDRSIALLRASGQADSSEIRIEVGPRTRLLQFLPSSGGEAAPVIIDSRRLKGRTAPGSPSPGVPGPYPTPAPTPRPPTPSAHPGYPGHTPHPTPHAAPTPAPEAAPEEDPEDPEDAGVIGPWAPEAELEVYVPRHARLNLETFGADVVTEALEGTIDLNSLQGDMQLGGRFRRVDAECLNCDMEIGPVLEALRISNVTGNVAVERVSGVAEISTVSGDVDVTAPGLTTGTFSSISGNLSFTGSVLKNGALFFETHSGTIDMNLPRGSGAEFDLSTFMGELATNIDARQSEESTRRGGRQVRFITGGGGSRISVKSFNGDITINETRR